MRRQIRAPVFRADARLLTSLTAFGAPKAVNDVRSRASARKTGAEIRRRISGADFWSRFLERVSTALG